MRKCSSFMCVLVVLLAGGAEAQRPIPALVTLSGVLSGVRAEWAPGSECVPMRDIYANGRDLIERMWNDAFAYTPDSDPAFSMWWFEGGLPGQADAHDNPNDLTAAALGLTVPDQCHLDYFHKDAPTPENENFTECHPWHANACCHDSTVVTPIAMKLAYGSGYEWDRCGPLSQACERFFVEEACFYECEPTAGLYRKYTDEQHAACSAAGVADGAQVTLASGANYTCVPGAWGGNDENRWQMFRMPIRASYADSWYRACANDLFCGTGDYFSCAGNYHEHLRQEDAAAARAAEAAYNASLAAAAQASTDDNELPTWAIIVIALSSTLALCFFVAVAVMYRAEKKGSPIFVALNGGRRGDSTTSSVPASSFTSAIVKD